VPTVLEQRVRRVLATLTALALTAGLSLVGVLAPAQADPAAGTLSWGVKESFRSYVTGPIAKGAITTADGTSVAGSTFVFAQSSDHASTSTTGYAGSVQFTGHDGALDTTFANLRVRLTSQTAGVLVADASGKGLNTGTPYALPGVELATLSLGAPVVDGDLSTWTATPATLTAAGEEAFAGFYKAGTALDPVTFSIYRQAAPEPEPTVDPTDEPTVDPTDEPTVEPTEEPSPEPTTEPTPEPTDPPVATFEPAVSLFAADGTTPLASSSVKLGDTIVVKGSGFDPAGNLAPAGARPPISAGNPAGASSTRVAGDQKWALSDAAFALVNPAYQPAIAGQRAVIAPDGTFTTTLTVKEKATGWPESGNLGVYTYAAGGTTNADQELYAPVTLAPPAPVFEPAVSLFAADGTTPLASSSVKLGDMIVVKGSGFDPAGNLAPAGARPPISAGNPAGTYVVFGKFADTWKPSAGAASSTRVAGDQKWALSDAAFALVNPAYQPAIAGQRAVIAPDGTFTTTLTVKEKATGWPESGNLGVYTYAAGGTTNADQELYAPVTLAPAPTDPEVPTVPTDPEVPTTPDTPVVPGSLSWGVKESFRSYITSPIAKGGISVLAPATADGSRYVFPQSSSALAGTTGSASYAGAVHFTGHAGALELTLSNPTVRVTGPTSGVLVVDAKGKKISGEVLDLQAVDFATLTLPTPTTAGGATTWTDAQATLTAAGATAFSDFYPVGAVIDPVTFTVGSDVGSTPGGQNPGTGPGTDPGAPVVVTPLAPGTYANAIASVTTVVPGGEVTFTGQGFGSGTENIEAAVYSERQLLASGITADASGAATATVTLPKNLAPGVHTLSLESPSGVRSQVQITVEAPVVPTAAQQCVARSVSGATLSWGVKESFRTYITGPIAKGSITPSGVTSSGSSFGWGGGSGKFNTEVNQGRVAFPGSVNFSGHGGILDLTISNVRVQVSSASTGSLVADVSSTDMNGTASQQKGVTIASLGLAGKKSTTGSTVSWSGVSATLTSAGASAFGGFYVAGDAMDPVSFSFPLGSEVDCDASSGANGAGSLATTGADGSVSAALAALLALTVGVGAVGLARRRRTVG
jgi:hypothetical protein